MSAIALLFLSFVILAAPRFFIANKADHEVRGIRIPLGWVNALYCILWQKLEAEPAPLPDTGPAILIANHTCAIDHALLQATTNRALGFLVAKHYYDHPVFGTGCKIVGCIPVRRDGRDLGATRDAMRALEAGRVVPIFPEGTITAAKGRKFKPGKAGVAFIAMKARVPVIPAFLYNTPASHDFWECFWSTSQSRILFGEPVNLDDLYERDGGRADIDEALNRMMNALKLLQDEARIKDPAWWNGPREPDELAEKATDE